MASMYGMRVSWSISETMKTGIIWYGMPSRFGKPAIICAIVISSNMMMRLLIFWLPPIFASAMMRLAIRSSAQWVMATHISKSACSSLPRRPNTLRSTTAGVAR